MSGTNTNMLRNRQMSKISKESKDLVLTAYSSAELPLAAGTFRLIVYRNNLDNIETVALVQGESFVPEEGVFVRLHSECMTGEVLGSLKCDCKFQLDTALKSIAERGKGVLIYLRQEGRGIGLGDKIKAYHLQNQGMDTVKANEALGFPSDLREFKIAGLILKDLGVKSIAINTNNPQKVAAMEQEGIRIHSVIPSLSALNEFNKDYLQTKFSKLGHKLENLFTKNGTKSCS